MKKIKNILTDDTIKEIFKYNSIKDLKQILIGHSISAGFPSPVMDYIQDRVDLNEFLITNPIATYFLRVNGISMVKSGIHPDDILIVDKSLEAEDRKIIVAELWEKLTVKMLRIKNERKYLVSENPTYKSVEVTNNKSFSVWGVVTYVLHRMR